ncbi:MAG TPA: pilus assembly protein N-terminal domain-containing protein [Terracidiphilus sp.]|nr:pilus assembly protein N-terminal domain-containing protein [Terracidiphilus sp.]
MRAKTGIPTAFVCALSVFLCAELGLKAQVSTTTSLPGMVPVQDSTNEVAVAVGKTLLIDTARPISRVAVGIGDVAEATVVTPTEIMINGKAPGETSLIIWDSRGGRQFFNITVRPSSAVTTDNLDAIRRELSLELPGQRLKVTSENNMVFLRGTVKDLNGSARAVQIASTGGKVVNLLNVDVPNPDPQILLKVRFASVDRSKEIQLGINLFSTGFGNTVAGITTGQFAAPGVTLPIAGSPASATLTNGLNLFAFFPGLNLGATLQALEQKGVVEVLAEPNVMAVNGKEASFLAGGEFPYPVAQASGTGGGSTISIEFKEFGVRLNFIPTITPRGTIRLQVAPEVSALDFTNAIAISGFDVPGLTVRKVKTEVELSDGQSFVIGGLLDKNENEAFQKIPFLGDIPILGKLFQSIQRTKTDTELIVIVTPEIVAPIEAGSALPELKYPQPFLPTNSGIAMNTPDAKTPANTPPTPPTTIPVETLIQSMKPEAPLIIEGATGGFGTGSGGISSAPVSAPATGSPQQ